MNDGRGEAGMVAPVFLVDELDDFLAPLVLEIDVDVGRLVALHADEALEQKVDLSRVDGGNAEAVTDYGVGRRTASLAEDDLLLGEADDVVHRQEVSRIVLSGA